MQGQVRSNSIGSAIIFYKVRAPPPVRACAGRLAFDGAGGRRLFMHANPTPASGVPALEPVVNTNSNPRLTNQLNTPPPPTPRSGSPKRRATAARALSSSLAGLAGLSPPSVTSATSALGVSRNGQGDR